MHRLHHTLGLLEYLSFELHDEPFNTYNNIGLAWIWRSLLMNQIIDFYKVITDKEKYSFIKIMNLSKAEEISANYEEAERKLSDIKGMYDEHEFETIRSKYLAHQDLNVPKVQTDLFVVKKINEKIIELFNYLIAEYKKEKIEFTTDILDSFREIFSTIDEYEKVKAFLIAEQIKGNKSVEIVRIANAIKEI